MPQLQTLDLSDNYYVDFFSSEWAFRGTLPAAWGQTRQAVQQLRLSSNFLLGTLPPGQRLSTSGQPATLPSTCLGIAMLEHGVQLSEQAGVHLLCFMRHQTGSPLLARQ